MGGGGFFLYFGWDRSRYLRKGVKEWRVGLAWSKKRRECDELYFLSSETFHQKCRRIPSFRNPGYTTAFFILTNLKATWLTENGEVASLALLKEAFMFRRK